MVYIDEKWLTIRGRWHYWFVVLEVPTELPVLAALLPSRRQWAWRWVGAPLRPLTNMPQVRITEGLQAEASLLPTAKHVLCRFHHPQGVPHWLKQHFATDAESDARQPMMNKVWQSRAKRTVRHRLARLRARASELGLTPWVRRVDEQVPQLICSVGSARLPSTTKAIERFFRALPRFYATRGGFHSVFSAKRELLLLLIVYGGTQQATTGPAPSEVLLPEARRRPLYRLINHPLQALQEPADVKRAAAMAALLQPFETAA
jgi:hypothetical protein